MENKNIALTEEEVNDLRKSLTDIGMGEKEIEETIEKAIKKSEEGQNKIEDQAKEEGLDKEEPKAEETKEGSKSEEEKPEDEIEKKKEIYKAMCEKLNTLQKSLQEFGDMYGEMLGSAAAGKPSDDLKKSIEDDIQKSFTDQVDTIQKSFGEKIEDIRKSFEDEFTSQKEIIKGLLDDVKKIGDTAMPMKSVIHAANFFEKGMGGEYMDKRSMSISRDKDDLIKSMEDLLSKSTDSNEKEILSNGISDFLISGSKNINAAKALATVSKKMNITLTA